MAANMRSGNSVAVAKETEKKKKKKEDGLLKWENTSSALPTLTAAAGIRRMVFWIVTSCVVRRQPCVSEEHIASIYSVDW
jgi:hypothetical protein